MQRFLKRSCFIVGLIALAGGGMAWWWHLQNHQKLLFRVAPVKRGDLVVSIAATGTIEPEEVVDVGAQVAGLIKMFGQDKSGKTIDYGSIIEEGTVLAQIDDSVYTADIALANAQVEQDKAAELSAIANLEQLKAKLIQAEAEWNRAQELNRSGLLALSIFDSNKADYEIAKANVSIGEAAIAQAKASTIQARAMLNKAQRNLDFCTIKSPVNGVIIDRRVNIGQTVVSSFNAPSLFLIAKDLTKLQIWVSVNEADVGRILPGTPVTFACDAFPGKEFDGAVGKVRLNATMTQNVVMYTVEVNAENSEKLLLPYLTANVRFVVRKDPDVLMVPNAALRWLPSSISQVSPEFRSWKPAGQEQSEKGGGAKGAKKDKGSKEPYGTVWLKENEFVRPIEVRVGASDGANTEIAVTGLVEGQEVVTGEEIKAPQSGPQSPFLPPVRKR